MPFGRVVYWPKKKGYGIIETSDGQKVFVHFSAIQGSGLRTLAVRELVTFNLIQGPKTLKAIDVTVWTGQIGEGKDFYPDMR